MWNERPRLLGERQHHHIARLQSILKGNNEGCPLRNTVAGLRVNLATRRPPPIITEVGLHHLVEELVGVLCRAGEKRDRGDPARRQLHLCFVRNPGLGEEPAESCDRCLV